MDKLSVKVLKYIASDQSITPREAIIEKFGDPAANSLSFLEDDGYIKSGRKPTGLNGKYRSNGQYAATSKGLAYLEKRPGKIFDHWMTRVCAIWGAFTGTAAIIAEIWLHFL